MGDADITILCRVVTRGLLDLGRSLVVLVVLYLVCRWVPTIVKSLTTFVTGTPASMTPIACPRSSALRRSMVETSSAPMVSIRPQSVALYSLCGAMRPQTEVMGKSEIITTGGNDSVQAKKKNLDVLSSSYYFEQNSSDFAPWDTNSSHRSHPRKLSAGSKIDLAEKFGFPTEKNAKARGFIVKNNPVVKLFDGVDLDLRLAVNTAQFGRVFEDSSHIFAMRPVPEDLEIKAGAAIRNLNVRGKRGKIVQVFPAVEYDFVPNVLKEILCTYSQFREEVSELDDAGTSFDLPPRKISS
ncbi:protein dd3-3-like [Plakobranchus ocellatus]|uniref:Protein dd3-3-like n=1 Tax=Plakobranchus ocellatus TaxID=259542 RepID=A0AAV4BTX4_9GAST|nr:protein dd3-3-like [Plakobranchus ocellatus]